MLDLGSAKRENYVVEKQIKDLRVVYLKNANQMFRTTRFSRTQFSITSLLCLTAIVGVLLAKGESWLTLILIEATIVFVSIEVLVGNLPRMIHKILDSNCRRRDGSWSKRREQIELKAVKHLRWDLGVVIVMILAPTTFMIWIVDREVVPLSIGVDAMLSFAPSNAKWKAELVDEEIRFDKWKKNTGNRMNAETHKRAIWQCWPLLLLAGVGWLAACCAVLKMTYLGMLKEMLSKARLRREQYMLYDLGQTWEPTATPTKTEESAVP